MCYSPLCQGRVSFDSEKLEEDISGAWQVVQLETPGVEELGAEQSWWVATQKAKTSPPAWLPRFMYSLVCCDSNTQVEMCWRGPRRGGSQGAMH